MIPNPHFKTTVEGLTSVTTVHNINKIKYPWRACLESALPVVQEAMVVVAGPHDDDTPEAVVAFAAQFPEKVVLLYGDVDLHRIKDAAFNAGVRAYHAGAEVKWPTYKDGLAYLTNVGMLYAKTTWIFQLQADEVLDPRSYENVRKLAQLPDEYPAASFHFTHFIRDFDHTFPFVYERVCRACATASSFIAVDDSVQFEGSGSVFAADINIFHLGKISLGRGPEAALKERDFQRLYEAAGLGFPDPLVVKAYEAGTLDYNVIFADAVRRGQVKEYAGPWSPQIAAYAKELGVLPQTHFVQQEE